MRRTVLYTILLVLLCSNTDAIGLKKKKKKYDGPPRSEAELVARVLNCLMYSDTITYATLCPEFDTVWKQILEYRAPDDESAQKISMIRRHPEKVQQFDPYYNPLITKSFYYVEKKGEHDGLHWHDIAIERYELQKINLTRDMVGYDLVSPVRYKGFVMIKDMLTRKSFVFAINEIQVINNYWYGGQAINIFEASSFDEYIAKEFAEMRKKQKMAEFGIKDSAVAMNDENEAKGKASADDDDDDKIHKEVADRKYYVGKFDNEISVKLYVRYMKGPCPSGTCSWEAIYKFGDQDEFVKLDVEKKPDGTWEFSEDPPIGGMDLILKDKVYSGNWMSNDNTVGYDVKLTEAILSGDKAQEMDNIIENGLWAKEKPGEKKDKEDKRDEGY
jgi:hypothetical protein